MKLFLSSLAPSKELSSHLVELIGKPSQDTSVALIENAADPYRTWDNQIRPALQAIGFKVEVIDLLKYRTDQATLKAKLANRDLIWIGGGNTYYIRWLLRETGADEIIKHLVRKDTVYGGDSAGAILAGPTIKHFETADDPNDAPQIIYEGLHLTEVVVVPHMDNAKFADVINAINEKLIADSHKTVPLGDAQALIINNDVRKILQWPAPNSSFIDSNTTFI